MNSQDRAEQLEEVAVESEYVVDMSKFEEIKHNWVKRGIKISCEGAGHASHSHFLSPAPREVEEKGQLA